MLSVPTTFHTKARASTVEEAVSCNFSKCGRCNSRKGKEKGLKKVVEILYMQVAESNSM